MDGAVTLQVLQTGHIDRRAGRGRAEPAEDHRSIRGALASAVGSDHTYIDDGEMDATGLGNNSQCFHIERSAFITLENSDLHDRLNGEALFWDAGGGNNLVMDHNNIYDDRNNTGGAIHTECVRFSTETNVTISRNHFWSCDVYDLFFSGTDLRTNYLLENNVFEQPLGPNNLGFAFRANGSPTPSPDGMTIRYNVFASDIQLPDGQPTANGLLVYGNYFRDGCIGFTQNTTYSYNVAPTGESNCGGTERRRSLSPLFTRASSIRARSRRLPKITPSPPGITNSWPVARSAISATPPTTPRSISPV